MSTNDKLFAGSVPEFYERFMVPLIFEPYARDLARRLAQTDPRDLLETAAGTGALTRAIAGQLPAEARIVATDLNQPMLDHAKTKLSDSRITWQQTDAMALPFADRSFDIVTCQFGAMFFPDKVRGYRKPAGRFGQAAVSFSTSGTASRTTSSRTSSPRKWRCCFLTILRAFWRARRTAITMQQKSARSSRPRDSGTSRSRQWMNEAGLLLQTSRQSPIAKAPR